MKESDEDVMRALQHDPNGIGYVSSASYHLFILKLKKFYLRALKIDGIYPSQEHIRNNTYPLIHTIQVVSNGKPSGPAAQFTAYLLSPEGRQLVEKYGFAAL